jgi:colanic acid biosynthesis glycosyl transferase WcaI
MGGKQGLDILADTARLLVNDERLHFVFCGNGAGRAELEGRCTGLANVRFLDLQPLERLGELLTFADIHLLPQRADAADLVMPSKLTGMLASGRPIVVTAHPGTEVARVVEGCGLVVEPERPEVFADAIAALASDLELRVQYRCGRAPLCGKQSGQGSGAAQV